MKKLYYLIVLVLILGLVLTGCSLLSNVGQVPSSEQSGISYLTKGGTEENPEVIINLLAGQTNLVGEVRIWNNDTNLYVKYQLSDDAIAEDLFLTETHLAVAISPDDIPQTNKGNPIPGHFFYSEDHGPVTEHTYDIPLNGWGSETVLYIAAHAVVERTETGTFMPELTWQRSLEPDDTMFFSGYGAAWTPEIAFTIPLDPSQTVWDDGFYYNNSVPADREWASWKYAYTDPDGLPYAGNSDLRRFQATFTIPEGYTVTGGSIYAPHFTDGIPINDNVYIFINQNLLFWGGTRVNQIPDGIFLGMAGIQALRGSTEPKETDRWYISGTIPEVTGFIPDEENVIDIFTEENALWGGMGKLVLKLDYEYSETAWADGTRFVEKGNWATYFEYDPAVLIDTVTVGSDGAFYSSSETLETGKTYRLEASGTFTYNPADDWADAEWYLKGGVIVKGDTEGSKPYVLDISINGYSINRDWGDYNPAHLYSMLLNGTGSTIGFSIYDSNSGDNIGSLTVDIYWIP